MEFALAGGLFFFIVIGAINMGLLMLVNSQASQSAGIGMITLADEGTLATADSDAIQALEHAGIGQTSLGHLDEIDIYHTFTCNAESPNDPSECAGQPDGTIIVDSSESNRYAEDGSCIGTCSWVPGLRHTGLSKLTTMGITLKYHYDYLGIPQAQINMTQTRYFRIEPQSP